MYDKLLQLENDAAFQQLQAELTRYDYVKFSGQNRAETRHSYTLSQLLNPHGKHGLGDKFVKQLLSFTLKILPPDFDYSDMWVQTEYPVENDGQIDILLYSRKQQTVVAIENKIDSTENVNSGVKKNKQQLQLYYDGVNHDLVFQNYAQKKFLFLTKTGRESMVTDTGNHYTQIGYVKIVDAMTELLNAYPRLSMEEKLRDYVKFIRRDVLVDELDAEQNKICGRIYAAHADAVNYLTDYIFAGKRGEAAADAKCAQMAKAYYYVMKSLALYRRLNCGGQSAYTDEINVMEYVKQMMTSLAAASGRAIEWRKPTKKSNGGLPQSYHFYSCDLNAFFAAKQMQNPIAYEIFIYDSGQLRMQAHIQSQYKDLPETATILAGLSKNATQQGNGIIYSFRYRRRVQDIIDEILTENTEEAEELIRVYLDQLAGFEAKIKSMF